MRLLYLFVIFSFFKVSAIGYIPEGEHIPFRGQVPNMQTLLDYDFRENKGQWNPEVKFSTRYGNAEIRFLQSGLSYAVLKYEHGKSAATYVWKKSFVNASAVSEIKPEKSSSSNISYFTNGKKVNGVSEYEAISYQNIYSGISARYYTTHQGLKYDFIVNAGANPKQIQMDFEGIEKLEVVDGKLLITTPLGVFVEDRPYAFQQIRNEKFEVPVSYLVEGNQLTFKLGEYDQNLPLVIDPYMLTWSTFAGGTGSGYLNKIVTDTNGLIYGTGYYTGKFPTTPGVYSDTSKGIQDVLVFKLDKEGKNLIYATFIGGSNNDLAASIAVDYSGNAYVSGKTNSSDFPVTSGAVQATLKGPWSAFALKLNPTGGLLSYSTYLGGNNFDEAADISADNHGHFFVAGTTSSADFPVTANVKGIYFSGNTDAFVTRINSLSGQLIYSTFIGGNDSDVVYSLFADTSKKHVYVTGRTSSADFPVSTNAFQGSLKGSTDGFIFKLNESADSIFYSSYMGGQAIDAITSVDVNFAGEAFLTGYTRSKDFPVIWPLKDTLSGESDAFIAKVNSTGSAIVFSTYIGGDSIDVGRQIKLSQSGFPMIVGTTNSVKLPVTDDADKDTLSGIGDVFFTVVDPDGATLVYSTYIGGSKNEITPSLALSKDECKEEVVIGLTTFSPDFKIQEQVFQKEKLNGEEPQPGIMKFTREIRYPGPPVDLGPGLVSCPGTAVKLTANVDKGEIQWSTGESGKSITVFQPGIYEVMVTEGCTISLGMVSITQADESDVYFRIPNVFTPNDDGINDEFEVIAHNADGYKLTVFNRWGMEVFQTSNTKDKWDGSHNGQSLPSGTYYYIVSYNSPCSSKPLKRQGTITLIR